MEIGEVCFSTYIASTTSHVDPGPEHVLAITEII